MIFLEVVRFILQLFCVKYNILNRSRGESDTFTRLSLSTHLLEVT